MPEFIFYTTKGFAEAQNGRELENAQLLGTAQGEARKARNGHEYMYSEGGMAFPDPPEKPSRTISPAKAAVRLPGSST